MPGNAIMAAVSETVVAMIVIMVMVVFMMIIVIAAATAATGVGNGIVPLRCRQKQGNRRRGRYGKTPARLQKTSPSFTNGLIGCLVRAHEEFLLLFSFARIFRSFSRPV
jgi:hypothetical protein